MEMDNLEPRLQALEALAEQMQAEKAQAAQDRDLQSVLDTYGMQFNNRKDVGMEILNQLSRQGVDVSAASSNAVQDIITDMQAQISQLYDDFNQKRQEMDAVQREAADLADQVNKMDEVVMNAANEPGQPDANIEPPAPEAPAPDMSAPQDMPPAPDAGMAPPPAPDMGAPAPDAGMPPAPEAPAPEMAAPAPMPQEPAPNMAVSDERMKNIDTRPAHVIYRTAKSQMTVSDERMKEVHKAPSFGSHLINIARRGW